MPDNEPSVNLRDAERAIVRALRDAGFGPQSQVTHADRFEIATDAIIVRVEVNNPHPRPTDGVAAGGYRPVGRSRPSGPPRKPADARRSANA